MVKPTSPNSCVVDFDYYFDKVSDDVIKNDIEFSNEVQLEDIKICEEVQKRLESRVTIKEEYHLRAKKVYIIFNLF